MAVQVSTKQLALAPECARAELGNEFQPRILLILEVKQAGEHLEQGQSLYFQALYSTTSINISHPDLIDEKAESTHCLAKAECLLNFLFEQRTLQRLNNYVVAPS